MSDTVVAAPSIVRFENVSKAFGAHVVYDAMDLEIRAGETFTIIGGSGEGKSVCLKMMIGLLRPDAGRVIFKDVVVSDADDEGLRKVRRQVAYVFQGGALFDSLSVLDNIGYGLREHEGMGDDAIRARALECLDLVGLKPDDLALMPASLSMGMRKRVALARSIALRPEVILYDEPTTGLDPKLVAKIGDMILKLQRELRVTSVVVTHDMPTAHKVSDRVAMLYGKKFPFVGPVEEMWRSPRPEVRDFIHGTLRKGQRQALASAQHQEASRGP
jgi:phospholipid/cholesterol/gamma-HCH transport system ATP-binding protein